MLMPRSLILNACLFVLTPIFSLLIILSRPFGFRAAWFWGKAWSGTLLLLTRILCGIRVEIEGRDRFPDDACVVMAKHQSAWETIAMPSLVPPFVWVLKRELLQIPLFGWALRLIDVIAIQRSSPREALKQVIGQGMEFLRQGRWVIIFPEGTRSSPGTTGNYQASGVMLAQHAGAAILPMAHNAGRMWPKRGFIKRPGTIRVRFLPLISKEEVSATPRNLLLENVKHQIETATRELGG